MSSQKGNLPEVLEGAKRLTPEEQRRLIDELSRELERSRRHSPVKLGGLWEGVQFSEEEIDQARRELWGELGRNNE